MTCEDYFQYSLAGKLDRESSSLFRTPVIPLCLCSPLIPFSPLPYAPYTSHYYSLHALLFLIARTGAAQRSAQTASRGGQVSEVAGRRTVLSPRRSEAVSEGSWILRHSLRQSLGRASPKRVLWPRRIPSVRIQTQRRGVLCRLFHAFHRNSPHSFTWPIRWA